ncbi:MAG: glycosyltransferase family 4 protein [Flectobacillus sp.]|nr:glycosyltransferase family 4 protein [Flectobacillus sp.]
MIALFVILCLFIIELIYFKIAQKFNIIDKPNSRSSHTEVTIRGGGIIFWASAMIYFVCSDYSFLFFFMGLSLVTAISFLDDVLTLPNRYRLPFQFLAIILILFELHFLNNPIWVWVWLLIMGVGIINAYNFMDGINGITGGYSTVVIGALWVVNNYHVQFISNSFIIDILLGLTVFNLFNFRIKARCFAGDVGSVSIAFIVLFLIIKVSVVDQNPIYLLFLTIYGVDSVCTIIQRLWLKQNIFQAHRLHLFQVIVHDLKVNHLQMAAYYMASQALICYVIIENLNKSVLEQLSIGIAIVLSCLLIYISLKSYLVKLKRKKVFS